MSLGLRSQDSAAKKRVRAGAVAMLLMACAGGFVSLTVSGIRPATSSAASYNGAVANQPDILLTKTTYCVAGPRTAPVLGELRRAVEQNDQASFDDLFANHSLLTLYPGNVVKPLKSPDEDGTQFVELPQPVAGYVTCWLLGDRIH